jgi:hypothetical protein
VRRKDRRKEEGGRFEHKGSSQTRGALRRREEGRKREGGEEGRNSFSNLFAHVIKGLPIFNFGTFCSLYPPRSFYRLQPEIENRPHRYFFFRNIKNSTKTPRNVSNNLCSTNLLKKFLWLIFFRN